LYDALVQLGHDVVEFDFDLTPFYGHADPLVSGTAKFVAINRGTLENELLRQVRRAHAEKPLDVLFTYFYSAFARPQVIREITATGITTVNWYCNASYQFHLVSEIAPAYSFCLVPERFRLDNYREVGAHPVYCQEAANPVFYRPYDLPYEYDMAFVGAAYGNRPAYLRTLLRSGLSPRAWGPGWEDLARPLSTVSRARWALSNVKRRVQNRPLRPPRLPTSSCGGILTDEEMVRMFSKAKISLGFSSVGSFEGSLEPVRQVRLRDFEVPMSGAFYMLEYLDEIEAFFVPGKEIVCFDGERDLVEKARYYLDHDEEREAISQMGHARALRDHTWQKRLSNAFVEMGLDQL
jgi:spore maturation protein CgeB